MSTKPKRRSYVPRPHINAEPHRLLMEFLESMSEEELMKYMGDISVEVGIYTPDGQLTDQYKDPEPPEGIEP